MLFFFLIIIVWRVAWTTAEMAYLNVLSICVLVAAAASGNCFFSSLMNEPLNFAVSLLDGQGRSRPPPRTTSVPYPSSTLASGETTTRLITLPDSDVTIETDTNDAKQHKVIAKKMNLIRDSFKSKKSKAPKVDAIRVSSDDISGSGTIEDSGFGSSSEEFIHTPGKRHNYWKNDRGYKRVIATPMKARNQRLMASISNKHIHSDHGNKHIHSDHGNAIVHASPLKGGRQIQQSGWKKNTWFANRSGGSHEKLAAAKSIEPKKKFASSSSEEYIIITKSAKPSWRASKFRSNILGYSNRGSARFTNNRRLPVVRARKHCGVCS